MQKGRKVQPVTVRGLTHQEDVTTLNVYASSKSFKIYETKYNCQGKYENPQLYSDILSQLPQ